MSWEIIERDNKARFIPEPIIALNPHQIIFNAAFVQKIGLFSYNYVNLMIDEDKYELGFIFHNESDEPNRFKLTQQRNIAAMSSTMLIKKYPWVAKVAKNHDPKKRRFEPIHDKNIWYIRLTSENDN